MSFLLPVELTSFPHSSECLITQRCGMLDALYFYYTSSLILYSFKKRPVCYNYVNFITNPQHSDEVIHITHIGYVDNFLVKTLCNRTPADGLFYGISAIGTAGKPYIFLTAARGADGVAGRLSTFYPHPLWISGAARMSAIRSCLSMRNNAPVEHCVVEAFILHRNIERSIKTRIAR